MTEAEQREQLLRDLRREQTPERPPPPYWLVAGDDVKSYRRAALERDVVRYDRLRAGQECPTDPQH